MCKICKALNENKIYKIEGSWTNLEVKRMYEDIVIQAYGDGVATMNINYCPMCGRKLTK